MLEKIFNLDNPFFRFIGKILDAIILNFIWMVCSLPIVTFGASTTALYYALMRDASDEEPHVFRAFFRSFKQNFKQATGLGFIYLGLFAMLAAAAYCYGYIDRTQTFWNIMKGACIIVAILVAFTSQYAFAVLANFHTTVKKCLQTAFYLSIKNFGWTIVMLAFVAAEAFVLYMWFFEVPILLLGVGLIVYLDSYILNKIFKPWFDEARANEDKGDDNWVMPDEVPESLIIPDDPRVAPPREDEEIEEAGAVAEVAEIPEATGNSEATGNKEAGETTENNENTGADCEAKNKGDDDSNGSN